MTAEIFSFCEFASQRGGSLSIQGAFDRLDPEAVPVFYTALRIRLPAQRPLADMQMVTIDPNGNLVCPPVALKVTGPVTNFVIKNRNVKMKLPGVYHTVLRDEGKMIASIPLFVGNTASLPKRNVSASSCLN
ncbi:MAG: hypothetical protein P1V20_05375 [Verrucomicrobiales bacterium]|nr:hypothetical protein [Verrucomicrobiales bacterium]